MFIHYKRFDESELVTQETSRVTLLEDGARFHVAGRVLVLGTQPKLILIPFQEIQWFWMEEN
jgi:hypothetical protein